MKKNNLPLILIAIVIALFVVWALFFRKPATIIVEPTEPVVTAPVLNNTIETSVTVIDPNAVQ